MKRGTLHALCDSSSFSEIKEYSLKTSDSGPHGLASDREGNIWFTANFKAYIGKLDPRSGNDVLDQELQGGKAMLKQMMFKQFAWLLCCVPLLEMALVTRGGDKPIRGSSPGNRNQESSANATSANSADKEQTFRVWGVRYQVRDVDRSVTFYTQHLGFELEQRSGSAFASVSNGGLTSCSVAPGVRAPARCPMDVDKSRADGIG